MTVDIAFSASNQLLFQARGRLNVNMGEVFIVLANICVLSSQ